MEHGFGPKEPRLMVVSMHGIQANRVEEVKGVCNSLRTIIGMIEFAQLPYGISAKLVSFYLCICDQYQFVLFCVSN